jgi:hypothetical protein
MMLRRICTEQGVFYARTEFVANYNFCWRPRYQDWSGKAGQLRPTPAMMAGVTKRLWKFDDLFSEVKARYLEW